MPQEAQDPHSRRRIGQASVVCFAIAGIAFVACAMGLFVNHFLTGSLAIGGTAAVGLIYVAMGLLNLDFQATAEKSADDIPTPAEMRHAARRPAPADFDGGAELLEVTRHEQHAAHSEAALLGSESGERT